MSAPRRPATTSEQTRLVISDHDLRNAIQVRLGAIAKQIDVQVERGDVYLKGVVGSAFEGQYVVRVIQQIAGVGAIRASLQTQSHVSASEPAFDWRSLPWRRVTGILASFIVAVLVWSYWHFHRVETVPLIAAQVSVRVENQPAEGAFLTLHPLQTLRDAAGKDLSGLRPSGVVQHDGQVAWTTWQQGDGLPAGQYVVTAIWQRPLRIEGETVPGPNRLPLHFSDPRQSPLRLLIGSAAKDGSPQLLTILPHLPASPLEL